MCAHYRGRESCLIGRVEPGSTIEPLEAQWRCTDFPGGRIAALKTLRLIDVREVAPEDHAVILVGRPIRGTFMRWPSARDTIANLVEGRPLTFQLDRLSPRQHEVLCAEFLRLPDAEAMGLPTLRHLVLPTGRTMKDLDLVGVATDGRRLLAQVTLDRLENVGWKVQRLLAYGGDGTTHLILFCRVDGDRAEGPVLIRSIDAAYDAFIASPGGCAWMAAALGEHLREPGVTPPV